MVGSFKYWPKYMATCNIFNFVLGPSSLCMCGCPLLSTTSLGLTWKGACHILMWGALSCSHQIVSTKLSVNHFDSIWYCRDCYTQLSFSSLRYSFSSLRHSCSKKFLWRLHTPSKRERTFFLALTFVSVSNKLCLCLLHMSFLNSYDVTNRKQLYASNSLHNTKTSGK